jgi:5-(carboxyamino)imidazole ribonucleotide mutase
MPLPDSPLVGVIMGSKSDYETMERACDVLADLGVPFEAKVVSAHRTPDAMFAYAEAAERRGLLCIVAAAGGAAHLPGMVAAKTVLPVLGVPTATTVLAGVDSLLSIVQMPRGVPVGTLAIGKPGAENAALLAASIVAARYPELRDKLRARREKSAREVLGTRELRRFPPSISASDVPPSLRSDDPVVNVPKPPKKR